MSLHGRYILRHHRVQQHTHNEICFCVGCDGLHGGVHWQTQHAFLSSVLVYMGITHCVFLTFLCLQSDVWTETGVKHLAFDLEFFVYFFFQNM